MFVIVMWVCVDVDVDDYDVWYELVNDVLFGIGLYGYMKFMCEKIMGWMYVLKYIECGEKIIEYVWWEIMNYWNLSYLNIVKFKEVLVMLMYLVVVMEVIGGGELFGYV